MTEQNEMDYLIIINVKISGDVKIEPTTFWDNPLFSR
jgi:hypothetical protein